MDIDLLKRISTFVTAKIAPSIISHGGHIEIVELKDNVLTLSLSGACSTCDLDVFTKDGIAEFLLDEFPELEDCQVIDDTRDRDSGEPLPLMDLLKDHSNK